LEIALTPDALVLTPGQSIGIDGVIAVTKCSVTRFHERTD
jgi:hypothetical protein